MELLDNFESKPVEGGKRALRAPLGLWFPHGDRGPPDSLLSAGVAAWAAITAYRLRKRQDVREERRDERRVAVRVNDAILDEEPATDDEMEGFGSQECAQDPAVIHQRPPTFMRTFDDLSPEEQKAAVQRARWEMVKWLYQICDRATVRWGKEDWKRAPLVALDRGKPKHRIDDLVKGLEARHDIDGASAALASAALYPDAGEVIIDLRPDYELADTGSTGNLVTGSHEYMSFLGRDFFADLGTTVEEFAARMYDLRYWLNR